ncbi:hypothetical protein [Pseudomonas sp. MWU12-2345]|uniref:hypothetical protein n=1 Tax=Pseudomonas sp. MWU12-2345 TaxID=2928689 RepID=UPI002010467D|nr:hypothetical protein [Pseudomonas sp. MWU12-2345]
MNAKKSISPKYFAVGMIVGLCSTFLVACSDSDADAKKVEKKAEIQPPKQSEAEKKFAVLNQPRSIELPALELTDVSKYQDMLNPMTALRIYTTQHTWDETQDDVVDSVKNAIQVRTENPDLYKYGYEILTAQDAFRKKDLSDKIFAIVKNEAGKSGANRLVKAVIPDHLAAYDFASKGFKVSSCMFSDKLEYSKEEMRNEASFKRASPTRCYYNPGPTDYKIGLTGGSKVFFDVPDEAQARKIEAARPTSNIVVYGYVKSIERETITDHFGPKRYVLVAPQRVDVVDTASGSVLLSKAL